MSGDTAGRDTPASLAAGTCRAPSSARSGYAHGMALGTSLLLLVVALIFGLLLLAGGITMLVIGGRRRDDSTSRPFLALGVGLLIFGTVVTMPALLTIGQLVVASS